MIIKAKEYPNGYTTISNDVTRDNNLSLGARGLLIFMLGCLESKYPFSLENLCSYTNTKIAKIRNYVNELENAGYLLREQSRGGDKNKGRFSSNKWTVSEMPHLNDNKPFGI